MSMNTNNIKVKHLNRDISIAQHTEYQAGVSETTEVQEIAILPSGSAGWTILQYNNDLNSLIETLKQIRTLVEDQEYHTKLAWKPEIVIELYDRSPDMTLKELSRRSGWSVKDLILLLVEKDMGNND